MDKKNILFSLPEPSTAYVGEHKLYMQGGNLFLGITCVNDADEHVVSRIIFNSTRAISQRAEGHCTVWHIDGCYDAVALVQNSSWLKSILEANDSWVKSWGGEFTLNHYIIYLDSFGALEVICQSVGFVDGYPKVIARFDG